MAIYIPHRFLNRLTSTDGMDKVSVMIIGTFNPGLPDLLQLDSAELSAFEKIQCTPKFQRFNEVMNFYDRPQNRFWKVMDHLNSPEFYADGNYKKRNINGLKYFRQMRGRQPVFDRQNTFCRTQGVLITDIVQAIRPKSFDLIYHNFPDTAIEKADPVWNDMEIKRVIKEYQPKKIIINFQYNSPTIPLISAKIKDLASTIPPNILITLPSTSGAAAMTYENLIAAWKPHF